MSYVRNIFKNIKNPSSDAKTFLRGAKFLVFGTGVAHFMEQASNNEKKMMKKTLLQDAMKQPSEKLKHRHMVIEQGFRDAGFKGPVFIEFSGNHYESNAFFYRGKFCATVKAPDYVGREYLQTKYLYEYSVSGHEAIHCLHLDNNLHMLPFFLIRNPYIWAACSLPASLLMMGGPFRQLLEIKADILSSYRLGTAKNLREYLIDMNYMIAPYSFISSHPSTKFRINYLSKLDKVTHSHKFFESDAYQKIMKERGLKPEAPGFEYKNRIN